MNEGQNTGLNQRALFADGTSDYRRPEEPNVGDRVVLRFRTARDDADAVFYVEKEKQLEARMIKVFSKGLFDFYEYVIVAGENPRH